MGWVQPKVLQQLREAAGLSPAEVAEASKKLARKYYTPVTEEQLQRWEQGQEEPELEHLETLAELYHCPVGHFFLPHALALEEFPLSFRGLAPEKEKHFSSTTRASLRRFVEWAEWFTTLLEESDIPWEADIPTYPPEDWESVVNKERERLGWSEDVRESCSSAEEAFAWWRKRIENLGVFCFELPLDPKDIRGASLWLAGRYPFLLVNHQDAEAATGRLFTLLHEYAHLLLSPRQGIACDFRGREMYGASAEFLANRFAARLLLPPRSLHMYLEEKGLYGKREWSDRRLKEIATHFLVSRDVVAITLEEEGLAPQGFYRRKREEWEKQHASWRPWGKGRPTKKWERKAREIGGAGVRLLLRLAQQERLPTLDIAYLLDTKVEKVSEYLHAFQRELKERQEGSMYIPPS